MTSPNAQRKRLLAAAFAVLFLSMSAPATAAMVPAGELLAEITEALAERGMPEDARIRLEAPLQPAPVDATGQPGFESVNFNPKSGRFLIRLAAAGDAPATVIAGVARAPIAVPMLINGVARGAPIEAQNLTLVEWLDAPPADAILDAAELEGALARRTLAPGAVLRRSDVAAAYLVQKGAVVSVAYLAPGLQLTRIGTAQSAGAFGDVIEIAVAGGRSLRAAVTGPNQAQVVGSRLAAMEDAR
jgi:flagella basal body P-ring formation protein FlgA